MSTIPDIRDNPIYREAVAMLQTQWPSDPFRPSAVRAQVSGIDCLAILYRFIHASLSRRHWPPVETGDAANQAISRYFWADFGHTERDDGPTRGQLRQDDLAQIQSTMQSADTDFAALCGSPAIMELVWARYEFCFYGTPWSRLKGDDLWVERTDLHNPTDMASFGRIDWNPKTHPALQDLVDKLREFVVETPIEADDGSKVEVKYTINEPLIVQVKLTVGEGVRMSLSDAHRFTAVTMRPGDNAPPVAGTTDVYAYDTAKTYGYVLAAVIQTRNATSGADHDTIRLFDTDGRECVPTNTTEPAGGESWLGDVKAALPEGQTFLLFYLRFPEFRSDGPIGAARDTSQRALTAAVDRKLAEDQEWFNNLSDEEGQRPKLGPGPGREQ